MANVLPPSVSLNPLLFLPLSSRYSCFNLLVFLLTLSAFSEAEGGQLCVKRNYLNACTLASSIVGTPDPTAPCFYGEEILVYYALCSGQERGLLHLHLLFGNHERQTLVMNVERMKGCARYRLMAGDYDLRGGVAAYKVELFAGDKLIDFYCHPLWAEPIELSDNSSR